VLTSPTEAKRASCRRRRWRRHGDPAGGDPAHHPPHALEVGGGGPHHVDPGIGVVDPVHGNLVDPEAVALGQDEQLGVEEPLLVLDEGKQRLGHVAADGLEAALGIGEPVVQGRLEQQVV
jgi:hypothetical protein